MKNFHLSSSQYILHYLLNPYQKHTPHTDLDHNLFLLDIIGYNIFRAKHDLKQMLLDSTAENSNHLARNYLDLLYLLY